MTSTGRDRAIALVVGALLAAVSVFTLTAAAQPDAKPVSEPLVSYDS